MIKASKGGEGKGIRKVRNSDEFPHLYSKESPVFNCYETRKYVSPIEYMAVF